MSGREGLERKLAEALCGPAARGGSGIVTATRGKARRLFCLDDGRLVAAVSNVVEEQLDLRLVQSGLLEPERRAELAAEARRRGTSVAALAREEGAIGPDDLRRAQESLVEQLLFATLEWPEGEVEFVAGRPNLADAISVDLSPVALVLRFARIKAPRADALRVRIGGPEVRFERADVAGALLEGVALDPAAARVLAAADDGGVTPAAVLEGTSDGVDATAKALYGLSLAGILVPARPVAETAATTRARRAGPDGPLTRDECLGRLAISENADHYAILGVDREASLDDIRDSYYALARRFHPDRFRSGPLQDLLSSFEGFFSRVTDAHNTLSNPDLRREYDRSIERREADRQAVREADPTYLARQNYLRAQELIERRRYNDAVRFLENAARLDGKQAEYRLALGRLLAQNPRRRQEACSHMAAALEIDPSSVEAYLALGQLLLRAGRPSDAARVFRSALAWDKANAEARGQLAALGEPIDAPAADPAFLASIARG